MVHIIFLMQYSPDYKTRNWRDFDSYADLVQHICSRYEGILKKENPNQAHITYNIMDLFTFLDTLPDCSLLINRGDGKNYVPYDKEYIKEKVFHVLRNEVKE